MERGPQSLKRRHPQCQVLAHEACSGCHRSAHRKLGGDSASGVGMILDCGGHSANIGWRHKMFSISCGRVANVFLASTS